MSDAGATAVELNTIAAATVIPVVLDSDGDQVMQLQQLNQVLMPMY